MTRILPELALLGMPQNPLQNFLPTISFLNGKSRQEELLRADHKKNLEDAAAMAKLAEEVIFEFEKDDRYVVSC